MEARSLLYRREISWEAVEQFLSLREEEREWLEYKREVSDEAVKAIAAMANTNGGLILIGVEESREGRGSTGRPGRVVGVPPEARMRLEHQCRDLLDPPFIPEIRMVEVPAGALGEGHEPEPGSPRYLLVVRVDPERAPIRPVIFRTGQAGKVLIRRGASSVEADPRTLRNLFAAPPHPAFPIEAETSIMWTSDDLRKAIASFVSSPWIAFRLGYEERRRMGSSGRPWSSSERMEILNWMNDSPLAYGWKDFIAQLLPQFQKGVLMRFDLVESRSQHLVIRGIWSRGWRIIERYPVRMSLTISMQGSIALDIALSGRISWELPLLLMDKLDHSIPNLPTEVQISLEHAILLMGMGLLTVSHPKLIERCFPEPGWSPRLRGCLLIESWLGGVIAFNPRWPRVGSSFVREAILNEPWEGGGTAELIEILRRFWWFLLSDLGYLDFENDLNEWLKALENIMSELELKLKS